MGTKYIDETRSDRYVVEVDLGGSSSIDRQG